MQNWHCMSKKSFPFSDRKYTKKIGQDLWTHRTNFFKSIILRLQFKVISASKDVKLMPSVTVEGSSIHLSKRFVVNFYRYLL